jgi:predicted phosphoribosyltransferase
MHDRIKKSMIFKDRIDAGEKLAIKLEFLKDEKPIILAIPRGGVVLGDVIAKNLGSRLDIIVSRKVSSPNNQELAIGAVMHDGSFYPNPQIIKILNVPKNYIDNEIDQQLKEIDRRLIKFRGSREYQLKERTVVLVDDGIATGATMSAVLDWVNKQNPARVIVAIPIGSRDAIEKLSRSTEVIVLDAPISFSAVGEFYNNFEQVDDSWVIQIMNSYGYNVQP